MHHLIFGMQKSLDYVPSFIISPQSEIFFDLAAGLSPETTYDRTFAPAPKPPPTGDIPLASV